VPAPEDDPGQAASAFLGWLAGSGRSWLVVLDDLGAEAAPDELWPRGEGGRVLVTADRRAAVTWIPGARLVPVGTFSPREALSYLFAKLDADPDQRNGALDLATGLGFLPSALAQAAAVMAETGVDCRRYLAELASRQAARGGSTAGDPAVMAAEAWSLSAGFADHLPPAGLALRALCDRSERTSGGNLMIPRPDPDRDAQTTEAPAAGDGSSPSRRRPGRPRPGPRSGAEPGPGGPGHDRPGQQRRDRAHPPGGAGFRPAAAQRRRTRPGGEGGRRCARPGVVDTRYASRRRPGTARVHGGAAGD
jgi:hypothetical protein